MAQTSNAQYDAAMADNHKAVDYILAIAGWPTLYSVVKSDYTLAGDLANFDALYNWMDLPKSAGARTKGRPEEGSSTIGEISVAIQDTVLAGTRHMTDLTSRFAYLLDQSTGVETQINALAGLSRTNTTVTVDSTTGFASSGRIWIGQECIAYTGTTATTFTGCTRGSLLTDAAFHVDNQKVYGYLPNLYRRTAYLYKGTQGLTLDKWLKCFGGPIISDHKDGTQVYLTVEDARWWAWMNHSATIANPWLIPTGNPPPKAGTLDTALPGSEVKAYILVPTTGDVGDGHFFGIVGGEYFAILDEN